MASEGNRPDISVLRIPHERKEEPRRPGGGRRWALLVAAIVVVLAGVAMIIKPFGSAAEVELGAAALTYPSQASAVLTASGYVVAQLKAAVASKGAGRLEFLGVEEGDKVTRGQLLARLEDGDFKAQLSRAIANLEVARAEYSDAERTLHRARSLVTSNLSPQADLDAAQARYERVKASITAAEASVKEAEVALEYTRIRAPFDGTVLTKNADVGEVVAPFAASLNSRGAVVTIADMGSLQVEADVSESNIKRVTVGQPCEIVLDAYPERRYRGKVHKIVPTADRAKATVLTKVAFLDKDDLVLPEMSAKVTFLAKDTDLSRAGAPPKLTVPVTALVERNGRQVVLVVLDDRVTETAVATGDTLGDRMEITQGLQQGDRVVLRPTSDLVTGSRISSRAE